MNLNQTILLCFLIAFWAGRSSLQAQSSPDQFIFQHLQEKDGLSINMLNSLHQDRDGLLWIGTFDGLNRYDGDQFVVFKHEKNNPYSLLNNTVHDLCEDQQGNIWMGVENGISCYEKATGRFRNISEVGGRPLQMCGSILCDRQGNIWFTSLEQGLFCYNTHQKTIRQFAITIGNERVNPLNHNYRNGMVLDPHQNRIWIASRGGLSYFDMNQKVFVHHQNNPQQLPILNNHHISGLTRDGDQLIFADNHNKQIIFYDLKRRQIVRTLNPTTTNRRGFFNVATIFVDRQHNLWMSSWNSAVLFVEANTYRITELKHDNANPTTIAGNFFWGAWQHPDGTVWLGTLNGISQVNPQRSFYKTNDLSTLYPALIENWGLTRFHDDSDGIWWLGSHWRGLLRYLPQTHQLTVYKLPDASPVHPYGTQIAALLDDGPALWLATYSALYRFEKQTGRFTAVPLPPDWPANLVIRCGVLHQRQIWLGTTDRHVFRYDLDTGQWHRLPVDIEQRGLHVEVLSLLTDPQGDIWADVVPDGFARFDPKSSRFRIHQPGSTFNQNVANDNHSCAFDDAGNLWKASNGFGLWQYNPKNRTLQNWTESDGLAYDRALGVASDPKGNIWVGSYNKFSVFAPAQKRFLTFTLPINQADYDYNDQLFRLRNGHVLALLKGHLVEFFPERLHTLAARLPERVLISQIQIADTVRLIHGNAEHVDLRADQNTFAFRFAAVTSLNETPLQYQYQLDGYEDWKPQGSETFAVYTQVPGGNYTFRVKAVTPDGKQTTIQTLTIHIDTPFYRAFWFWAIIGLLLLGLLLGFLKYRAGQLAQVHQLQVQASRLERDKSEIQYQNLINHLNPHFLFNSLTSLNSLIITSPREASSFLQKLSVIYRYILQSKDKDFVSLGSELAFAQHYIDLQLARFEDGLQINIEVDESYLDFQIVPVTLQNLLENAIKHNIIDDERPLIVRIYAEENWLCVANTLNKRAFVQTSNKQGLASMKSLYDYLTGRPILVVETASEFIVKVPLA
jgi:ligand-binding sensor domain-containing protein